MTLNNIFVNYWTLLDLFCKFLFQIIGHRARGRAALILKSDIQT